MTEIVVYTALFGGYDKLIEPKDKFSGCKFICFTDDDKLESKFWEIIYIEKTYLSNHMMNRKIKLFPHLYFPNYKYSLYVDSNIEIMGNPRDLVYEYKNKGGYIYLPKHMERDCIYREAKECVRVKKETADKVDQVVKKYREDGYPEHNGLFENNIILRQHNEKKVIELMEMWWRCMNEYSQRDQLSLCYSAWCKKIDIGTLKEGSKNRNAYFKIRFHTKEKSLSLPKRIILYVNMNKHRSFIMKSISLLISSVLYFKKKLS
jgi:hypothetical protein